ncbi:tetratricopeptide repeat protein [candidate division KSB1 bacterium]|nr:tetratricopeptide repeat protein [candidate division KSB1 bacterium]
MKTVTYSLIFAFIALLNPLQAQVENMKIQALQDSLKQHPDDSSIMMQLGKMYHALGAQGEKDMVGNAEQMFQAVIEREPNNADAHCWYGSVLTLKGRDSMLPFNKMRHVKDGNKEMDLAVSLDSTNIAVRLTRANTSLALPSLFNRIDYAIADFKYYVSAYEMAPQYFNEAQYGDVLVKLGHAYQKKGLTELAKATWQKVIDVMPNSVFATNALKLLKEMEG